jgi:uncharacterized membrane protein
MEKLKLGLRWLLTIAMVGVGVNHFLSPATYVAMMPDVLPAPLALVYISGVFEILGGLGLILRATRRFAAWGLIALYIAVFPANVQMAVDQTSSIPVWALYARLPLQLVLIAWAYWYTRDEQLAVNTRGT